MRNFAFILVLTISGCYIPGHERYSELPEYYALAVRISKPVLEPGKRDTVLKPVYGWKSLYSDTALVVADKLYITNPGIYKAEVKFKWQNADGRLTLLAELSSWNIVIKLQEYLDGENEFEQYLNLNDSTYALKLGMTNGVTPETEDPSLLKSP